MSDSVMTRIKKLEKKEKINELPTEAEKIEIMQALIFPLYVLKTSDHSLLQSHTEVLDHWKKKLGKEVYMQYTQKLLKERNTKTSIQSNNRTVERIKVLQKSK